MMTILSDSMISWLMPTMSAGRALGTDVDPHVALRPVTGSASDFSREVVLRLRVARRLRRQDEIHGREPRSLVHQLHERVLRVVARLAPDDHARLALHGLAVHAHALAARLHLQLLQVGREALQAIVVRQDGLALGTEEVVVPVTEQRQHHRHVLFHLGLAEMQVHLPATRQQSMENRHAGHERH